MFSPVDHRLILTAWSLPDDALIGGKLANKGIICIFRTSDLKLPFRY